MRISAPKLSILIATQGRRNPKLRLLLAKLMPQVKKAKGDVEVIAYWNNGETTIGDIRKSLLHNAKGEYICYIDDDDMVPDYYIKEILKAMGHDYIGFKVQLFENGVENKPAYHSLRWRIWEEDDAGFYRGITHLNPIRRDIALQGDWMRMEGMGEDFEWAKSIAYLPKHEHFIDKVMYIYNHDMQDTSFGGDFEPRRSGYKRPKINYEHFRWHPKSKLLSKEAEQWLKR